MSNRNMSNLYVYLMRSRNKDNKMFLNLKNDVSTQIRHKRSYGKVERLRYYIEKDDLLFMDMITNGE